MTVKTGLYRKQFEILTLIRKKLRQHNIYGEHMQCFDGVQYATYIVRLYCSA